MGSNPQDLLIAVNPTSLKVPNDGNTLSCYHDQMHDGNLCAEEFMIFLERFLFDMNAALAHMCFETEKDDPFICLSALFLEESHGKHQYTSLLPILHSEFNDKGDINPPASPPLKCAPYYKLLRGHLASG